MDFSNVASIKNSKFDGFVSFEALKETRCREVPAEQGVYLVLYSGAGLPDFLKKSVGGHFKGKNPSVSIDQLESKWIEGTPVLYIGQAGGGKSSSNLRRRLHTYLRFGGGEPVAHWGGRYIWQTPKSENLKVCWLCTNPSDARDDEKQMIANFETQFGRIPFANLQR